MDAQDPRTEGKILAASLLTIPIGLILALAFTSGMLFLTDLATSEPDFLSAMKLQGAAAMLELLSEPFYNLSTVKLEFGVRVWTEGAAMLVKNGSILGLLILGMSPALAFSWAQIAYAFVLLVGYSMHFFLKKRSSGISWISPTTQGSSVRITMAPLVLDASLLRISGIFATQACGKLLLAEGSKAVLTFSTPLQEQGVYGLVTNLGSLVVRTLFQPYEEVAFVAFSRPPGERGNLERAELLRVLCRSICFIGCLAASFGPAYSYVALFILYGPKWASTDAPSALAIYSLYVALLAVNGTLEAFVHAVADARSLYRSNVVLAIISIIHIGLSVLGVKNGGATGLLLADAANMAMRIAFCSRFIRRFFKDIRQFKVAQLLPSKRTLIALVASMLVTTVWQAVVMPDTSILLHVCPWWRDSVDVLFSALLGNMINDISSSTGRIALHVGVGALALMGTLAVAVRSERDVLVQVAAGFKRKRD